MVTAQTIQFFRRDTVNFNVTVKDSSGDIFNLTDYDARFTMKKKASDLDDNALIGPIDGVISEPETGIISFSLSVTDTNVGSGSYYFDVQINNGTTDVKTVSYGEVIILQDITVKVSNE